LFYREPPVDPSFLNTEPAGEEAYRKAEALLPKIDKSPLGIGLIVVFFASFICAVRYCPLEAGIRRHIGRELGTTVGGFGGLRHTRTPAAADRALQHGSGIPVAAIG